MATADRRHAFLLEELDNFREIARVLMPSPGEIPCLEGIEIGGLSMPLRDVVGGDHTIYLDFNRRFDLDARIAAAAEEKRIEVVKKLALCRTRAGILLADVSGHRITDAAIAAMLHQAFLVGCSYELEMFGEVTTHLFERLKTRFHQSSAINKFFTLVYLEIWASGHFRFISAGHLPPYRFTPAHPRPAPLAGPGESVTPVGLFASPADIDCARAPGLREERFVVQAGRPLDPGDVLVLCTDGVVEHAGGGFFARELGALLARGRDLPVTALCEAVRLAILGAGPATDDMSLVLIRRT